MTKTMKTAICLTALVLILWTAGTGAYADYGFSSAAKGDYGYEQAKKGDHGFVEASGQANPAGDSTERCCQDNSNDNNCSYCQSCRCIHQYGCHRNTNINCNSGGRAQQNAQCQPGNKAGNPQSMQCRLKNK